MRNAVSTELDPDAIRIDGRACYDVPGLESVEQGSPRWRTEDCAMYESGVKVGITGGNDEVPAHGAPTFSQELPKPAGAAIGRAVNARSEKNSTPPDCKPETPSPDHLNSKK